MTRRNRFPPGHPARPFLIAGPCVIESRDVCLRVADHLARLAQRHALPVLFKASFDKANRTSHTSFRGLGLDQGLRVLETVRDISGLPVLTDVHECAQVDAVAEVVDVLQIPAFLARQTDLVMAAAASGRLVNLKKAQFMAPADMTPVVAKARAAGAAPGAIAVTERGTAFGYNTLVVDMPALIALRATGCPVIFDATHAVQRPGALGHASGGDGASVAPLARAAIAVGIDGLFLECHPEPAHALSDGPNAVPLDALDPLIARVLQIAQAAHGAANGQNGE